MRPSSIEPVPVPNASAIASVPEPIHACPECGFLGIKPATQADGVYAGGGELTAYACPRCDHVGLPAEFDQREDYLDFVQKLNAGGTGGA